MKIERISKKNKRNVIIDFDDSSQLIINYEVLLKYGLRKGMEISSDRFSFLVEENEKHKIKIEAINYLAKRTHSEKEIRIKLQRKKHNTDLITESINDLKERGLIDDYKYSLIFADEKIRLKLWGEKKIMAELIKRGVSNEIIEKVINEKFTAGNDIENAVELAGKKVKSLTYKNYEKRILAGKIFSYLISKGYNYQVSREAVEKVLNTDFVE